MCSGNLVTNHSLVATFEGGEEYFQHTLIFAIGQGRLLGVAASHAKGIRVESFLNDRRHGCWALCLGCGDLLNYLQKPLIATILLGCGSLCGLGWGPIPRRSNGIRWVSHLFRNRYMGRRTWSDVDEGSLSRGIFIVYIYPSLGLFYPYSNLPLSPMFIPSYATVNQPSEIS